MKTNGRSCKLLSSRKDEHMMKIVKNQETVNHYEHVYENYENNENLTKFMEHDSL